MKENFIEIVKASPVAPTTAGAALLGVPLNEWVMYVALIAGLLQIFFLLRDKWWRAKSGSKE